jgi:murein L,D-transpeptidase YcbB/YkuD
MRTGILSAALTALVLQPGVANAKKQPDPVPAAPVQLPYQSANLPTSGEVRAFYASYQFAPIWFSGNALKPGANELIAILKRAPLDGLATGPQYAAQAEAAIQQAAATGSPQAIAYAEHTLSEAVVLYSQIMNRTVPGMIYGYDYMKPKPLSAATLLRTAAGAPSLQMYLQQIANPNPIYTAIRDAAWKQMQANGSTIADPRVVANLNRVSGMPAKGRFVLVNPATQMLYMYNNGVPVDSMKVVVGDNGKKYNLPTPMITSMIFYAVHNPYWNAPDHLVKKNIAPLYLKQGESYLKWRGYQVMSDWSANASVIPASEVDWKGVAAGNVHIRVRQKPGPDNFMGNLKFPFANPEDIFLHDSPEKELFARSDRMLSNGCIRLEDAKRLGRWLLGHDPVPPNGDAEYAERLPQGVPVYVTYLTAQAKDGELVFTKDVYGLDPASTTRVAAGQ